VWLLPSCKPASAPVTTPADTEYFDGTSEIFPGPPAPGAAPIATNRVLIRRTVDRERSVIEEEVVSEEGRGRPVKEYLVTMTVSGVTFTMAERGDAFHGAGTLEGSPWGWTAWSSHSVLPDGSTVDSRDRLSDRGLEVEKEYRGARGTVHLRERFSRIDREAYARRRADLEGGGASWPFASPRPPLCPGPVAAPSADTRGPTRAP
jgi:hypothetical protein